MDLPKRAPAFNSRTWGIAQAKKRVSSIGARAEDNTQTSYRALPGERSSVRGLKGLTLMLPVANLANTK